MKMESTTRNQTRQTRWQEKPTRGQGNLYITSTNCKTYHSL